MINFEVVTREKIKDHNPNWPESLIIHTEH